MGSCVTIATEVLDTLKILQNYLQMHPNTSLVQKTTSVGKGALVGCKECRGVLGHTRLCSESNWGSDWVDDGV